MNKQETKAAGIEYNNFGRVICGEKKLYVTILNSKVSGGSFTFETANGSVRIFNTECTAAGAPDAIGYAIVKVIHDARVLNYMEQ